MEKEHKENNQLSKIMELKNLGKFLCNVKCK
jgi:hypothetical protein